MRPIWVWIRSADGGTAVVEFTVIVVMVIMPLMYGIVVISRLHSASAAAIVGAREASRAYVLSSHVTVAGARARSAASIAMADQGFVAPVVSIRCLDGACLAPRSRVRIEVTANVELPFVPFGQGRGTIPVTSTHEAVVDTYRSAS